MQIEFHTCCKGTVKLLMLIFAEDVIGQSGSDWTGKYPS